MSLAECKEKRLELVVVRSWLLAEYERVDRSLRDLETVIETAEEIEKARREKDEA